MTELGLAVLRLMEARPVWSTLWMFILGPLGFSVLCVVAWSFAVVLQTVAVLVRGPGSQKPIGAVDFELTAKKAKPEAAS